MLKGISRMEIYTEDSEGYVEYIWNLSNDMSESEWWRGSVSFTANRLTFLVSHDNNNSKRGYVALDGITFDYDTTKECEILPPDAAMTRTPVSDN